MADETQNTQTADQSAAQGGQSETTGQNTQQPEAPGADEKKFSQKELDDIVKQRLDRAAKGQPSKEELAEFHKWQDDQKSAEQKHTEALRAETDRANAAEKKAAALEAKLLATSKGVSPGAADDVVALASLKVGDDMPLDKAIDEVLKKYPQFAGNSAPATTGVPGGNGGASCSGVEAAFRAKNPNIKI